MIATETLRIPALVAAARKAQPAPGLVVDRPFPGPEADYLEVTFSDAAG